MIHSPDQGCGATFRAYRDDFHALLGSDFRRPILIETNAHEGPVYVAAEHALYFTTLPEPGPTVWFTDPNYGELQGFKGTPKVGPYVYRHDPATGETTVVADSFNEPNGIAFSPDESVLCITDTGANQAPGTYFVGMPHHVRAFDVHRGRQLRNERLFAVISPGVPDGIKVDVQGRVYTSSATGVQVFTPDGDLLGEIMAPGVANFTFGGPRNNVLFILGDTVIWQAQLQVSGNAPA